MNKNRRTRAFWTLLLAIVLMTSLLVSCTFIPSTEICGTFNDLGFSEVTEEDHRVVFENQGEFMVVHGFACALEMSGSGILKVEQSLVTPTYTNATVFLNGWKANFLSSDDHHVQYIATAIGKISMEGEMLTWNAAGMLNDDENDGEDAINWCYYYTVIAWQDGALNAVVDHDDADSFCQAGTGASDNFYFTYNEEPTTALSSYSSFLQNPSFPPDGNVAVLPRGFGVGSGANDHHLLQVAYNSDHSETFIEHGRKYKKAINEEIDAPLPTPASRAGSGFVSWQTYSIFKDNERQAYGFGEMVSGLAGNDVGIIQPPFSILPMEGAGFLSGCGSFSGTGIEYDTVDIENVPFEFAIPMLTGWDLSYPCDDEHVKEIGVWIDEWDYVKSPAAPTGTLTYVLASVLRDKDNHPEHLARHKVTILGLR